MAGVKYSEISQTCAGEEFLDGSARENALCSQDID